MLADRQVYAREICSIIERSNNELIQNVEIVSVYEGNPIPQDKKSVSIKVTFASKERTLSPEEIDTLQKNTITILNRNGYQLR